MAITVKNTKDLQADPKMKMLVYGAPGTGKTTFAGSFPKPIYLNIERGLDAIIEAQVDYVDITSWDDLREVVSSDVLKPYETIIVDSISELQEVRLAEIKKANGGSMPIQEWGTILQEFRGFIKTIEAMDKHIVFIAHETEDKDEQEVLKRFDLSGQLKDKISRHFNIIGYQYVEMDQDGEPVYRMRVKPNLKVYAKTRYPKLPAVVENATFDGMYPFVKASASGKRNPKLDEVEKESK